MLKKVRLLILVVISTVTLNSCGSDQLEDQQLSGFMLGGIYFLNGYGGTDSVADMMEGAGYTSDEQLISGYKEIFEFAFQKEQGSDIKMMLKQMWEITNKKELLESIEDLKTREHPYKAWDYARIVNNASMGYAASFLTKDEVIKITQEVLPLAKAKFSNWEEYYVDYNKGRIDWNAEDPEGESFEKLSNTITKYDNSIYKILPLN